MIRDRITKDGKKKYQAIVRVKGYPPVRKTWRTRREAEAWEIKTKAAMKAGVYKDETRAQEVALAAAIDRYIREAITPNTKNYKTLLGQLSWWQGGMSMKSFRKRSRLMCVSNCYS